VSQFPHTIQVAARTAIDDNGVPAYGTPVEYRANVQGARVIVTSPEGVQIRVPGGRIFIPGRPAVDIGARVTHGTNTYEVMGADPGEVGIPAPSEFYARLI